MWDKFTTVSLFIAQALAWLWLIFGKLMKVEQNSKRIDVVEAKLDKILEGLDTNNLSYQSISVALFGISGDNGLRGELKEVKQDVKAIVAHMMHHNSDSN